MLNLTRHKYVSLRKGSNEHCLVLLCTQRLDRVMKLHRAYAHSSLHSCIFSVSNKTLVATNSSAHHSSKHNNVIEPFAWVLYLGQQLLSDSLSYESRVFNSGKWANIFPSIFLLLKIEYNALSSMPISLKIAIEKECQLGVVRKKFTHHLERNE